MKKIIKKIVDYVETYKEESKRLNRNIRILKTKYISDELDDLWTEQVKSSTYKQLQKIRIENLEKSQLALSFIVNDLEKKVSTQKGRITRQTREQNKEKKELSSWVNYVNTKIEAKI